MKSATSLRQPTNGFSKNRRRSRPRAMKSEKPFGSPVRKAIHRSMSTPPKSHAVLVQWWMSRSSMSESRAAPAPANRSASPLASTTTRARIACRPSLLSKMAPWIRPSSAIGATAQAWRKSCTLCPSTMSRHAVLSHSGSMVGDQVTTPWKAAVRWVQ